MSAALTVPNNGIQMTSPITPGPTGPDVLSIDRQFALQNPFQSDRFSLTDNQTHAAITGRWQPDPPPHVPNLVQGAWDMIRWVTNSVLDSLDSLDNALS